MNNWIAVSGLVVISTAVLTGCERRVNTVVPPPANEISNTIGEMYLRAGLASEVARPDILGKHYRPGRDAWKVVACATYTGGDGAERRDCNDSFELYKLDSGKWMVNGTVNGNYLWLEMP